MKTLLFLLATIMVGVIGLVIAQKNYKIELIGHIFVVLSVATLSLMLLTIPIMRANYRMEAVEYKEFVLGFNLKHITRVRCI